jgi:hypothetical protein
VEPIKRLDALRAGKKFFYSGRPCQKGHLVERFVSTGTCTECNKVYSRESRAKFTINPHAPYKLIVNMLNAEDMKVVEEMARALNNARKFEQDALLNKFNAHSDYVNKHGGNP